MRAQFRRILVGGEARRVGGDLEQHAAGLAEVDCVEVLTVDDWRHVQAISSHALLPFALHGVGFGAERNVVDRAGPLPPDGRCVRPQQVHHGPAPFPRCGEPVAPALRIGLLADVRVAEQIGQHPGCRLGIAHPQRHGVEAVVHWRLPAAGDAVFGQLDLQAVRVAEAEHLAAETQGRRAKVDGPLGEAAHPGVKPAVRHGIGHGTGHPGTRTPGAGVGEREEGHNGAGVPGLVAVVEVVGVGRVEVDGLLHEALAKGARVEVDVALRRAGDRSHVVQARDAARHRCAPMVRGAAATGRARRRSPAAGHRA